MPSSQYVPERGRGAASNLLPVEFRVLSFLQCRSLCCVGFSSNIIFVGNASSLQLLFLFYSSEILSTLSVRPKTKTRGFVLFSRSLGLGVVGPITNALLFSRVSPVWHQRIENRKSHCG